MRKYLLISIAVPVFLGLSGKCQNPYQPNIEGANPVSPQAFSFTKYTEMPVSDYTGIPNISVPLYTIKVDDVTLPIELSYHSVGIKVNQEASWVGLGWDLSFGSIVQNINDVDDYYNYENGLTNGSNHWKTKLEPDYSNDVAFPWEYPYAYAWYLGSTVQATPNPLVPGYFSPVLAPQAQYGYKVATDYYFPQGGNYVQNTGFFTDHQGTFGNFDSEPDIFTANFLGHSLTFMLDWNNPLSNGTVVLNKKGYSVQRVSTTSWKILTPQGDQFYFETQNTVNSYSSGTGLFGDTFSGTAQPSSNMWLLTRIITNKGRTITINYSTTGTVNLFPNYSEVYQYATLEGTSFYGGTWPLPNGYVKGWPKTMGFNPARNTTWSYSTEQKFYPSSITFDNGTVNFYTSASQDQEGGMRLDSLHVNNSITGTLVDADHFNYGFYDTVAVAGNGDSYGYNPPYSESDAANRLKLLSVMGLDSGQYTFTYDPKPLPKKNSFAQDFWGYYNGQTGNAGLTPNPGRFPNVAGTLPASSDNHSAFLSYCRAGILTGIQYPTGGTVGLSYELNQFNNYFVPDSNSTTNTINHGNGLRIHSVTYGINGSPQKDMIYSYDVGKSIYPVNMFRLYTVDIITQGWQGADYVDQNYNIWETNANGFYSSNPLIGSSGVGYDTVTKSLDSLGVTLGKTVSTFYNTPALGQNIFSGEALSATLPAIKSQTIENGSLNTVMIYDKNNVLQKQEQYSYTVSTSPMYYGARMFGFTQVYCEFYVLGSIQQYVYPQNMIGFYPIYDVETLPTGKTTTEYAGSDALVTNEGFNYDQYDQLTDHIKYTSGYYESDHTEFCGSYFQYTDQNSINMLYNAHRFSDVLMSQHTQGPLPYKNETVSSIYNYYEGVSGVPVKSYSIINKNLIAQTPLADTVTYDSYDPVFINNQQMTSQKEHTAVLWDYNGRYPIAMVKNAAVSDVAYTSFEADGSGNWSIASPSRVGYGITGGLSYNLANGNISASNLNASMVYTVSYWSSGSSYAVTGSTGYVTGKTITIGGHQWTYYEHTVSGVTSVQVSGGGNIDELRLYPKMDEMSTFTYTPLLGMTAECDINNRITYYFYDATARLVYIKDQDGNVVKAYCYKYSSQPSPCKLPNP